MDDFKKYNIDNIDIDKITKTYKDAFKEKERVDKILKSTTFKDNYKKIFSSLNTEPMQTLQQSLDDAMIPFGKMRNNMDAIKNTTSLEKLKLNKDITGLTFKDYPKLGVDLNKLYDTGLTGLKLNKNIGVPQIDEKIGLLKIDKDSVLPKLNRNIGFTNISDFMKSYNGIREVFNNYHDYAGDEEALKVYEVLKEEHGKLPDINEEVEGFNEKQKEELKNMLNEALQGKLEDTKQSTQQDIQIKTTDKVIAYAALFTSPTDVINAVEKYSVLVKMLWHYFN